MSSHLAKVISVAILTLVALVYYGGGLRFQVWIDSSSYLEQGLGIAGELPYARMAGRTLGYPLLVAAAFRTPAPLLALWLAQAAILAAAFAAVHLAITRWVAPALAPAGPAPGRVASVTIVALALASSYSLVHVQAGALLTEALFASLALAAVLSTMGFARLEPGTAWPHLKGAAAAAVVGANLLVKPHWLAAAGVLALIIAAQLWRLTRGPGSRGGVLRSVLAAALAIAVPFGTLAAITAPDRALAERVNPRDAALFGPRSAFCNHAHLIDNALGRRPSLKLHDDTGFDQALRSYLKDVRQRRGGGWRRLGFDGDLCTYDKGFSSLLDRHLPEPRAQARFLLGALLRASLADPLPFIGKVLRHLMYGFTAAFEKFAHHARPGLETFASVKAVMPLPGGVARGVVIAESLGPLGTEVDLKQRWTGRVVHAALALVFFALTALLCATVVGGVGLITAMWRTWDSAQRRRVLVHVGIPLAAILGHHAIVALTHSFDIWRYGYNMFFVNLLLIGGGLLLFAGHASRAARPVNP